MLVILIADCGDKKTVLQLWYIADDFHQLPCQEHLKSGKCISSFNQLVLIKVSRESAVIPINNYV